MRWKFDKAEGKATDRIICVGGGGEKFSQRTDRLVPDCVISKEEILFSFTPLMKC